MRWIYELGILLYGLSIRIAALFSTKARRWVAGRKGWYPRLGAAIAPSDHPIWFHCASLGEFEQGRPLLERIKREKPERKILLTFFSPSGYEQQKDYPLADYIFYLPLDTHRNMKRFVRRVRPAMLLLIKYEFWPNLLRVLRREGIPVYCVSATFRADQLFFKPQGRYFLKTLQQLSHFFVQDALSLRLLETVHIKNALLTGDTRYDRVLQIKAQRRRLDFLERFKGDQLLFIAGSTWRVDEALLTALIERSPAGVKYLIAPHDIEEKRIQQLLGALPARSALRYTQLDAHSDLRGARVLILDTIGLLTSSYAYGDIAYVGGGFGKRGIHNVLEPAVFGNAVCFGPIHDKFVEAQQLLQAGAACRIDDSDGLVVLAESLIFDAGKRAAYGAAALRFVERQSGSTAKVYNFLKDKL